jgi:hypothetical protein
MMAVHIARRAHRPGQSVSGNVSGKAVKRRKKGRKGANRMKGRKGSQRGGNRLFRSFAGTFRDRVREREKRRTLFSLFLFAPCCNAFASLYKSAT